MMNKGRGNLCCWILIRYKSFLILSLFVFVVISCTKSKAYKNSLPVSEKPSTISYNLKGEQYEIESGFNLEIVASEPLIESPVEIEFDDKGRIWVVELNGFMQDINASTEDLPIGKIKILEDLNNDGIYDHSKIFIDSLVLPRAIALVYNGLLYAEPPNLWFVDIENDKPINKTLIDSLYTVGKNAEHQSNGLMMHLDNWIYNARSSSRYQRKDGVWQKEKTTFRGQWGITKDNFGRLYYNVNSIQLIGDLVLPNVFIKNQYYEPKTILNQVLTENQRVYPIQPTAVNRGYVKGVLDKDSLLINTSSACGPLIYRGYSFSQAYYENSFVCIPEANLIKRHVLDFSELKTKATQAVSQQEFLVSLDESFRPVNLNNAPDGNLYIVDMHQGVIQDKVFMSPYLKNKILEKGLDTVIGMGRILKVTPKGNIQGKTITDFENLKNSELVYLLNHGNGWVRDRVQQKLILANDKSILSELQNILNDTSKPLGQIHALYTLEGMNMLGFNQLQHIIEINSEKEVLLHAIRHLGITASENETNEFLGLLNDLITKNDDLIDLYVLASLREWIPFSKENIYEVMNKLANRHKKSLAHQEALNVSIRDFEEEFLMHLKRSRVRRNYYRNSFFKPLNKVVDNKERQIKSSIYSNNEFLATDSRTEGYTIFKNYCAGCHGMGGEGIENLAPPLINSEYITESDQKLALTILHGLSGPIHVKGKKYDLNMVMPGLNNNPDFSDDDIMDLINYLNNAFSEGPNDKLNPINVGDIENLRKVKPKEGTVYTEKELNQY